MSQLGNNLLCNKLGFFCCCYFSFLYSEILQNKNSVTNIHSGKLVLTLIWKVCFNTNTNTNTNHQIFFS